MRKIKVSTGIFWVEIPEAELYILCGCPPDSVKHMMRSGLITSVEKNGVSFETGPNAVLLSDIALQNQRFSNLAEFPVLQMLYRQGMIIPGHPNNTGKKPLLIGLEEQVKAQADYIYRGNYGLATLNEITETGIPADQAKDLLRMKLRFSFGRLDRAEDLLEVKVIKSGKVELRNGVFIERLQSNVYELSYKNEHATVDLNLRPGEEYQSSYVMDDHYIKRDYFSVVHIGEGDGWNPNQPCMGSIVIFQGKIYLIDAGPNILNSLTSLGLSANDIEGIFHTHTHDDHFCGLPILIRADHKIKYFAAPLVRATAVKKLCALMGIKEQSFGNYFEVRDLAIDVWNDIEGLEVMPVLSPHPVETTIFFFRALWEDGYKTYAHLADICAFGVLREMITPDKGANGISKDSFEKVKTAYLTPVDLKKVDIGGGMIHGNTGDFSGDTSARLILSHSSIPLSVRDKELGSSASFGTADVLISAEQDYLKPAAMNHFQSLYAGLPMHELRILVNCPSVSFNPGYILIKNGQVNEELYFVLSGVIEFLHTEKGIQNYLGSGSMIGELSGLMGTPSRGTFRAVSRVRAIRISSRLYKEIAKRNGIFDSIRQNLEKRAFLQHTHLFGEMISCPHKNRIAGMMKGVVFEKGELIDLGGSVKLYLLESGLVSLSSGKTAVEQVEPGNFFGVELLLFGEKKYFEAKAAAKSKAYTIPGAAIQDIPIVQWKMVETFKKRLRKAGYINGE